MHQPPEPQAPTAPAPSQPAPAAPAWRPLHAFGAFLCGLVATFVAVGVVAAATGTGPDEENATFTVLGTLLQSVLLVGAAVLFASLTAQPRPWQFGLRRTRFWPAVGWAALGMTSFYVFAAVYAAAVSPDADQRVTEALGADQGALGLVVAGVMVMVVAPVAEEVFFRGFFYRALRNRLTVIAAAAVDGLLFGVIHYDFSGGEALLLVPPLGFLGFVFCLVYERTGSLFPVIGLHALNNSLAFGYQADGWEVSAALGPLMLVACALVPRLLPDAPRAATAA